MSYRKRHIQAKIKKIKPKKSIFSRLGFWYVVFSLIILAFLVYFFVFSDYFKVKNVVVLENQKINQEAVKKLVLESAEVRIFNFYVIRVNSKSLLLVNKKNIARNLLDSFVAIEQVLIDKHLPDTLNVKIMERKPIGSYCDALDCYLIDSFGVAFEKSYNPESNTIVRHADRQVKLSLGKKVLAENVVLNIYKIQKLLLDNFNITTKEALIFDSGRLNVTAGDGWKIYFNLNENINAQLTKLESLLGEGISPKSKANLYYIDLRPEDRAIICDNSVCAENL